MAGSPSSNSNPSNVQGVCPNGWHVPSRPEWDQLILTVGGISNGGDLKETGFAFWNNPNTGATNNTGFSARGAGEHGGGMYRHLKEEGIFWTTTEWTTPGFAYTKNLDYQDANIDDVVNNKTNKMSCRCVKD